MVSLRNLLALMLLYAPIALSASPRFIFSFGDSYTAYGFNINGTKPTSSNPLGNPAYGQGTSCKDANKDGAHCPNWIDILTVNLSASNTLTFNLAQAGSVISEADSLADDRPDFRDQLAKWNQSVAKKPSYAEWTATNSVFLTWFGVNDLRSIGTRSSDYKTNIGNEFKDLFEGLREVYNQGMRRFVILNAAPFTRNPRFDGQTGTKAQTENITYWNSILPNLASDWAKAHSGSIVKVLNTSAPFDRVLSNPDKYPNAWSDGLHPGAAIHNEVANSAYLVLRGLDFYS